MSFQKRKFLSTSLIVFKDFYSNLLNAYSSIFFVREKHFGLFLLIVTFLDYNIGLGGFISVVSAYLFARFIGKFSFSLDYYIYNPLLVGFAMGYMFKLNWLSALFISSLGILSYLLTFTLSNILGYYLRLPVLSLPFVITTIIGYLASVRYSDLMVTFMRYNNSLFAISDPFFNSFFRNVGLIYFINNPIWGLAIFLFLAYVSPILSFLAFVGFISSSFFLFLLTGSWNAVYTSFSMFNSLLVAMAIGGVFLVPSLNSYVIATVAAIITVTVIEALNTFWKSYGIFAFALPFNFIVLLFIYTLGLLGFKYRNYSYSGSPEKSLDVYVSSVSRFPFWGRDIALPFTGKWTVWQGFNDVWTHKGAWKFSMDFLIKDEKGKTFRGDGTRLDDYYAYKKPVLSPVSGRVVDVVSNIDDSLLGYIDSKHNWGNYVIIYDERGFYAVVAHLLKDSVRVKQGQWVEKGEFLGLCGNSGNSPQPHIHVHVQYSGKLGAPTAEFAFSSYMKQGVFYDMGIPEKGDDIEPVYGDAFLKRIFSVPIDFSTGYELYHDGSKKIRRLRVGMDSNGAFYIEENRAKLFFTLTDFCFYFYLMDGHSELLKLMFACASKVPLNLITGMEWEDILPYSLIKKGISARYVKFVASFYHDLLKVNVKYKALSEREIMSVLYLRGKRLYETRTRFSDNMLFETLELFDKDGKLVLGARRV